jgi:hypothetical protein
MNSSEKKRIIGVGVSGIDHDSHEYFSNPNNHNSSVGNLKTTQEQPQLQSIHFSNQSST